MARFATCHPRAEIDWRRVAEEIDGPRCSEIGQRWRPAGTAGRPDRGG